MYDRRLAIESVTRLGHGQFVLAFESPQIAARCQPGHFVMISVTDGIDPLLRRPMAIYRVLRDGEGRPRGFNMVIEVVGRGTALLESKSPGDTVDVLGPLGTPFSIPDDGDRGVKHLLVMGGVGAAPFPFVAERLLERGAAVRAFVGARGAEALLCVDDFEAMNVPVAVATDDGSRGHHGFVTAPLSDYLRQGDASTIRLYACGPTPMMRAVHDIAVERNIPLQVSFEAPMACGIGVCLSCVLPVHAGRVAAADDGTPGTAAGGSSWHFARCCREGPVFDSRNLVWD